MGSDKTRTVELPTSTKLPGLKPTITNDVLSSTSAILCTKDQTVPGEVGVSL